jgi:Na+/proline symporter
MSISNPDELRFASVVGTVWNVIMAWGAIFIGLLGRALIKFETLQTLPASKPQELVYLVLASKYFGPILYGIIIGGIFAAILSTADSQLLVIASTFVRDIYEKIINKNNEIAEKKKMILSRTIVVLSGITAMILAYYAKESIFWLVLNAWGGLGAAFGTTMIFTLYWKGTTKYGIFAGFITGATVNIIWWYFLKKSTGIYELIPAFISASIMIIIVSLITKTNNKENND